MQQKLVLLAVLAGQMPTVATTALATPGLTHGPFVGHVTPTSASVWARCAKPGRYELTARRTGDEDPRTTVAEATVEENLCVVWKLQDLAPNGDYRYEIVFRGERIAAADDLHFQTAPPDDSPARTTLAFGSCAREDAASARVWKQIATDDPDAIVLLGDTPYIDSTELARQRTRYQQFAAVEEFAQLLKSRSWYATWDDHDFGRNDTDGTLPGKATSRRAFLEYHANPSYGNGVEGIYTKFRRGPVEVFLLDPRYFAGVEPSSFDPDKPTLLGAKQWEWLERSLKTSTAPFKILAGGMIYNGAVRPNKPDHWGAYAHERQALLELIGREKISGVVLVGGDIHRTRVLTYDTTKASGYPITELITSPIHDSIIEAANAYHPGLTFDAGMPHTYLLMEVDARTSPAILTARFKNAAGEAYHVVRLIQSDLQADGD